MTRSILITDDDDAFRETLLTMLEPCGYDLLTAGDGDEALQIVHRRRVDLVLLDFQMPRLSGLECAQQLQQTTLRNRWILISAGINDQVREQAQRLNVFSLLPKPVTRQVLSQTVNQAMSCYYG
ncbi:MAG: response regulator [Pirellulales bacterium]|nr:response regulator [Pirellulales bacterium]